MIRHYILLLTLSTAWCHAQCDDATPCEIVDEDENAAGLLLVTCTNISDFSSLSSAVATSEKNVVQLHIVRSPQLVFTRSDFEIPAFETLERFYFIQSGKTSFVSDVLAGLSKLKLLSLAYNNLTSLDANSFSGLSNIRTLFLDGNQIATIDGAAFSHFNNLTELDLRGNSLTSISPNLFAGLNLTGLDLGKNKLRSIDKLSFNTLDKLVNLDISGNLIRTIDSRAFQTLEQLDMVELGNNRLELLDSGLFENNSLTALDLSNYNLENTTQFPFNIPTLKGLKINNCNIDNIPLGYFDNLPNLVFLNVERNRINKIEAELFSPLTQLRYLSLNGNQLTSLSVSSFSQFYPILKKVLEIAGRDPATVDMDEVCVLEIESNPWDCEHADMVELRTWCVERAIPFNQMFSCRHAHIVGAEVGNVMPQKMQDLLNFLANRSNSN